MNTEGRTENPGECSCCQFITNELTCFKDQETTIAGGGKTRRDDFWYCELCSGTMASTFDRYPGQHPSGQEILKAISYVGNSIIAAIRTAATAAGSQE